MRKDLGIAVALTLVVLVVNAKEKLDTSEIQQRNVLPELDDSMQNTDSGSFINSDSRSSSKSKTKLLKKPIYSKNPKRNRESTINNSKLTTESKSAYKNESSLRKKRNVEDNVNNESITTTELPLEDSTNIVENTSAENIDTSAPTTSEDSVSDDKSTTLASETTVPSETISENEEDYMQTTIVNDLDIDQASVNDSTTEPALTSTNFTTVATDDSLAETINDFVTTPENTENDGTNKGNENEPLDTSTKENTESNEPTKVNANGSLNTITVENTEGSGTFDDDVTANTENEETTDINVNYPLDEIITESGEIDGSPNIETDLPLDQIVIEIADNNGSSEPLDITVIDNADNGTIDLSTDISTEKDESSEATSNLSSTVKPNRSYNFLVYGDSVVPCTLATMTITLRIPYTTNDLKTITKKIQVPSAESAVRGSCGEQTSYMTLAWFENSPINGENSITFEIVKDSDTFYVSHMQVSMFLDNDNFPDAADVMLEGNSTTDLKLFSASVKNGIHVCRTVTEVPCGKIIVLIQDVSLIAYNDKQDVSYREEEHCFVPKTVSATAIVAGIVGLTVTIGIVASYAWYRKKTNTFRSELP